jgi:hypothetical protein
LLLPRRREQYNCNGQNENIFPTQLLVQHFNLAWLAWLAHRAIPELVAFQAENPTLKGPANFLQV